MHAHRAGAHRLRKRAKHWLLPLQLVVDGDVARRWPATHAGAADEQGREALLKYILRPPLSTERLMPGPDGLVRIGLKKPFSDGTVAVDLAPLSLLCRLAVLVPAPRFHTVRYCGVLGSASKWRPLIVPKPEPTAPPDPAHPEDLQSCGQPPDCPASGSRYRPWAELLKRTFGMDVETCPGRGGRMRLLAVITDLASAARFLRHRGEPTEPPSVLPLERRRSGRARLYDDTANPRSPRSFT